MIFILFFITLLIACIAMVVIIEVKNNKKGKKNKKFEPVLPGGWISLGVISLIALFFCCVVVPWFSWESYLNHRAFYDATKEQYFSALKIYADRAVLQVTPSTYVFNELRYEGYQQNLAQYINDLRESVIAYNEGIIIKRRRNENPFFDWMIIAPDPDMKPIELLISDDKKSD